MSTLIRPEVRALKSAFRKQPRLSVRQLSALSGVSVATLYQMFRGVKVPTIDTYSRVAKALGLEVTVTEKKSA